MQRAGGGGGSGQVSPVFKGGVLTFRLKKLGNKAWTARDGGGPSHGHHAGRRARGGGGGSG